MQKRQVLSFGRGEWKGRNAAVQRKLVPGRRLVEAHLQGAQLVGVGDALSKTTLPNRF